MKIKQFIKLFTRPRKNKYLFKESEDNSVPHNIGDLDYSRNVHEKLIGKLYNKYIENPDLYKKVRTTLHGDCEEIIIDNTRLKYYRKYPRVGFNYKWVLEYEVLDTQALFPEHVDGILKQISYDFDVRQPYSDFIEDFFVKKSIGGLL